MNTVTVITKTVDAKSSFRVDQVTLVNSALTSFKKFIGLAKIFIPLETPLFYPLPNLQGRRDLNPQSWFWRPVVCQLTDAPSQILAFTPSRLITSLKNLFKFLSIRRHKFVH